MFETSRDIPAPVDRVFAAFADPQRLARWWGPAGFTNTFSLCEFHSGGRWVYVMHGPDGHDYANESVFDEVSPGKIVIRHLSNPQYVLTILLATTSGGARVAWAQAFETERIETRLASIIVPANEQNLDRLAAEVSSLR